MLPPNIYACVRCHAKMQRFLMSSAYINMPSCVCYPVNEEATNHGVECGYMHLLMCKHPSVETAPNAECVCTTMPRVDAPIFYVQCSCMCVRL